MKPNTNKSNFLYLFFIFFVYLNTNAQIDENTENFFVANEVSKFNTASENLSLQRFVFDYKVVEKNIYLGTKFRLDTVNESFLDIGIRGDLKEGFSTFTKNGEVLNNYRGEIKFQFITKQEFNENSETLNLVQSLKSNYPRANSASMSQKQRLYYSQKEAQFLADEISDSKSYESLKMSWLTGRVNIPVAKTEYNVLTDVSTGANQTESYLPFSANLGYTWFKQNPKNSFTLSALGELKNFNSIEANKLTKYTLQSFNSTNSNLLDKTTIVYEGEFETFLNTSLGIEAIYLFIKNKAGLSFRAIQNFGKHNSTNWKIGIPFSVEANAKKPSITFELAYNKIDSDEFIGLNVAFAFANIIKVN